MTETETTFCKGYGFPPSHVVPTKRRRSAEDKYVDLGFGLCYRRRQRDSQRSQRSKQDDEYDVQRPQKRHIPNSFYGSQAARLGIIPTITISTLHGLTRLGRNGMNVCKEVPSLVCQGIPVYVWDVHRAGVVRSVFETMDMPGKFPNLDSWLRTCDPQGYRTLVADGEGSGGDGGGSSGSGSQGKGSTEPKPNDLGSDSDDPDAPTAPDGGAVPTYRPSDRPPPSSILRQSLMPARLSPAMKHTSQTSTRHSRRRSATTVDVATQTWPLLQNKAQQQPKTQERTPHPWKQATASHHASEKVASAILRRPVKTRRGRGSIFTPFSGAELRKPLSQFSRGDTAPAIPFESHTGPMTLRTQKASNARARILPGRGTKLKPILKKAAASAQSSTSTPPTPSPQSHAQGILTPSYLPDIYPHPVEGNQAILLSFRRLDRGLLPPSGDDEDDEEYLCTGAAGPSGTLNEDGSHVNITAAELQILRKAREDAEKDDSSREKRERARREMAEEVGGSGVAYSTPYFNVLDAESATGKALSLCRTAEEETEWMWKLAGLREEAERGEGRDGLLFPLNVPAYENLDDRQLERLQEDVELLDGWLASLRYTPDGLQPTASGQNRNSNDVVEAASERLAARTERLKAVIQREVDRQWLDQIAEVEREALSQGYAFPEGAPGWETVSPNEQELIRRAIDINRANSMSEKARVRMEVGPSQPTVPALSRQSSVADPALATNKILEENGRHPSLQIYGLPPANPDSQTMASHNQQAQEDYYAFKEKFEDPKWADKVHQIAVLRYRIMYFGRKWPDDLANWDTIPPPVKEWILEVTRYLELQEEFEGSDTESE